MFAILPAQNGRKLFLLHRKHFNFVRFFAENQGYSLLYSKLRMVEIFDNIRKLYQFKEACEELRHYIEFFSETSLEATRLHINSETFTVKLFPSYTPTIWLNLGTPYQLVNGHKSVFIDEHADILILRNQIVERRNLPTDNIFTVKFHPGGFEAVFGIEQHKIGNAIVDVKTILPSVILKKLKRLHDFDDRTALIQNHFLHLLNRKFADAYIYQKVCKTINNYNLYNMGLNNQQLSDEMAITTKTLNRHFKRLIGAPPKTYFSIVRARAALTAYVLDKEGFSSANYGYYDESHFYKDVMKFTGQSLTTCRS